MLSSNPNFIMNHEGLGVACETTTPKNFSNDDDGAVLIR